MENPFENSANEYVKKKITTTATKREASVLHYFFYSTKNHLHPEMEEINYMIIPKLYSSSEQRQFNIVITLKTLLLQLH